MEKELVNKADRLLITLLCLSIAGNAALAGLAENKASEAAALNHILNSSDQVMPSAMVDMASGSPPTMGSPDAPITIILFSDFECPYCREFSTTIQSLRPEQRKDIRLIFRQLPLPIHQLAHKDAELSVCAAMQSNEAFWALYTYLYSKSRSQKDPTDGVIQLLGNRTDVNLASFHFCLSQHQANKVISHDVALAQKYEVQATPTIFINGKRLTGNQPDLGATLRTVLR